METAILAGYSENVAPASSIDLKDCSCQAPSKRRSWRTDKAEKGRQAVAFAIRQTWTLTLLLRHPKTPWAAKLTAVCALGYLVSPIQLIPSFIPVIGQLDDLAVLFISMKLIRKLAPGWIREECEARARSCSLVQRFSCEREG
jgi:uncharacterized membrane protein YkvA (DUF1232 family)